MTQTKLKPKKRVELDHRTVEYIGRKLFLRDLGKSLLGHSKMPKCTLYPCVLVQKGMIHDGQHFPCVAFESNECIWKDK